MDRSLNAKELIAILDQNEVPNCLIYSIEDIFEDPQYKARENIISVEDPRMARLG